MSKSFQYLAHLDSAPLVAEDYEVNSATFLEFFLQDEAHYIPLANVCEVVAAPDFARVALGKPWFLGLLKVQSEVYSAIDFLHYLHGEPSQPRFAIALSSSRGYYALGVERMGNIVRVKEQPTSIKNNDIFEYALLNGKERKVFLVDRLLGQSEFENISIFNLKL